MRVPIRGVRDSFALPVSWRRLRIAGGVVLLSLLVAGPFGDGPAKAAPPASGKTPAAKAAPAKAAPPKAGAAAKPARKIRPLTIKRTLMTLRGEIVDYYCFIEKGATGPGHRECGVRCVAGDVCMGLFTTEDKLYMISVNHLRAMEPLAFKGQPDPFSKCRGLIAETVDLTGYVMERYNQRIIEIMDVKVVPQTASR